MKNKKQFDKNYWDKVVEYNENSMTSKFIQFLRNKKKKPTKQEEINTQSKD